MAERKSTRQAVLPAQAPLHNDKGRSALADLPKGPFQEVLADQSRYDPCFQSLVRYFCRKGLTIESSEDSAQEVLTVAAEISPDNTQHCLAWLARRRLIDAWRRPKRRPARQLVRLDQLATPSDPLASMEQDMFHAILRAVVDRLPDKYRIVVTLHYFDGYSQVLIAGQLGVHRNTVRTHLNQAHQRLRKLLDGFAE